MLTTTAIGDIVLREIRALLLEEDFDEAPAISGETHLHELGINSLMLARLLLQLETTLGADPFTRGDAAISDIRSVSDLIAAYQRAQAGGR
ncbi:MAG: phosphopantetheine-binding protein [Streptosporangiaceae bacterium]|jgi:acyl carrier protein